MTLLKPERLSRSERLRDRIRQAEVKRLFAEGQDDSAEWPAAEHAAYMAPWRETDTRGHLSPWYGPMTESAYEREMRTYQDTREAGSLWDVEEAARYGSRREALRVVREGQRYDELAVAKYVRTHDLREDERRVYYAFWVDGMSVGRIAMKLGMAHTAVSSVVRRLRLRARGEAEL